MPQLIAKGLPKARQLCQVVLNESSADMGWSSCGSWLAAVTTSGVVHLVDGETGAQLWNGLPMKVAHLPCAGIPDCLC
jgi:hypothetical protein